MVKRKLGALEKVDADLPNLQHKIRRDPPSYESEFRAQYEQYDSFRQLVMQAPASAPSNDVVSLRDLIDFISHVAACYPLITKDFPQHLIELLLQHHESLEPELREKSVGALVLLRKNKVIDSPTLLNALFPLLTSTSSKSLRSLLYQKIISDIRSSNNKATNHKLNRTLQTVLFNLVTSDRESSKGIWAVRITRELWRRQVWTDAKAVEIMKEAALSDNVKVIVGGVNFFMGGDKEREELAEAGNSSDEDAIDMNKLKHQYGINKKSGKAQKQLRNAAATVKRKERKKTQAHPLNFSALHLLHDPQGFAESLFSKHLQGTKSKLNLEQKLIVLQLVSRLVGLHKLTIINLYSYFLKYLTPKQASVTSFLASLAQATHELVPPDVLDPLVQKVANEFVSEASAGQVAAAGLNAIREICMRQPLAMNDTLLQDLVQYRKSKDKSVTMAARGLLSLYREAAPDLLKKRDRGKDAALKLRSGELTKQRFGEQQTGTIEGLELLEEWREQERRRKLEEAGQNPDDPEARLDEEDDEDWKNWEEADLDSDESETGWINVESDGEDIEISDSDDEEKPAPKKQKTGTDASTDDGKEASNSVEKTEDAKTIDELNRLATTRILTPADLAKLNELRQSAAVQRLMPNQRRRVQENVQRHIEDGVTAADLEGASKLGVKSTKEERIAMAKGDKDEAHRGATAKRKEKRMEAGKSTTNKEKARKKNMMMTLGKARSKNKRSLKEVGRTLKQHVARQKKGGRRGNN